MRVTRTTFLPGGFELRFFFCLQQRQPEFGEGAWQAALKEEVGAVESTSCGDWTTDGSGLERGAVKKKKFLLCLWPFSFC